MKIWYDYYNNIGVVIATKRCHYLFHLQVHKIQISQQEQKNWIIYLTGGIDWCTSRDSRYYCWLLSCHWITKRSLTYYWHITSNRVHCESAVRYLKTKGKALGTSLVKAMAFVDWFTTDTVPILKRRFTDTLLTVTTDDISTDCQSICRLILSDRKTPLSRFFNQLSTDIVADMLIDIRPRYRLIHRLTPPVRYMICKIYPVLIPTHWLNQWCLLAPFLSLF